MSDHPIIELFQTQAELLDIGGDTAALDDAIVRLAGWMELADLSENDIAVLVGIGGILYRDGLNRRIDNIEEK